ncbi:MAG: Bax inhibitor-1/YccA family protein [Planctomycetota bacterium]|jgi:FtsH-binding integral membrane protein
MSQYATIASPEFGAAFTASLTERQVFIRKTYGLFTATVVLAGVAAALISQFAPAVAFAQQLSFVFLIAWYGLQFAERPLSRASQGAQLALLAAFGVVVAGFSGPLIAAYVAANALALIIQAFALASFTFGGLTLYVMFTKKDFSWMGPGIAMLCWLVIGVMIIQLFVPFPNLLSLGISCGVIMLMSALILYETSNILHHYSTNQAPLAAARLFTAFFVLFIHILRVLSASRD